jgi:hypothetical protein
MSCIPAEVNFDFSTEEPRFSHNSYNNKYCQYSKSRISAMSTNNQIVVKIRFVAHTMGLDGWDFSRNHWSIFLILQNEAQSVRLNIFLADFTDESATFTVTSHNYIMSASTIIYFDYIPCLGLTVHHILQMIHTKGRHRYRMTSSGKGCRFWV